MNSFSLVTFSQSRTPWFVISGIALFFIAVAHFVFQEWLFMQPCEQCVYVRAGFFAIAIGTFCIGLMPRFFPTKIAGLILSLYGALYSLNASMTLRHIHQALHSEGDAALFGLQGCASHPTFPLHLPLDTWFPRLFSVTGECGVDAPIVPRGIQLEGLQNFFVSLYTASDGWYLIPAYKFLSMAECCAIFSVLFILAIVALGLFSSKRL